MTQIRTIASTVARMTARTGDDIDALSFPQQFVVWSVRAWIDGALAEQDFIDFEEPFRLNR